MLRPSAIVAIIVLSIGITIGVTSMEEATAPPAAATPPVIIGDTVDPAVSVNIEIGRIQHEEHQAYLAALEAERQAEQARLEAARRTPTVRTVPTGDCSNIPGWFPPGVAWRESRCSYDAYNPTGCGGNGCIGAFQFDARHFTGWQNGQAACGDLEPWTVDGQNECAWRLSRGGTYFTPWAA